MAASTWALTACSSAKPCFQLWRQERFRASSGSASLKAVRPAVVALAAGASALLREGPASKRGLLQRNALETLPRLLDVETHFGLLLCCRPRLRFLPLLRLFLPSASHSERLGQASSRPDCVLCQAMAARMAVRARHCLATASKVGPRSPHVLSIRSLLQMVQLLHCAAADLLTSVADDPLISFRALGYEDHRHESTRAGAQSTLSFAVEVRNRRDAVLTRNDDGAGTLRRKAPGEECAWQHLTQAGRRRPGVSGTAAAHASPPSEAPAMHPRKAASPAFCSARRSGVRPPDARETQE